MQIKALTIAAAVALAFTGVAQAQQSQDTARPDAKPRAEAKVDRQAKKTDEDRIEADAKAAKAKCGPLKGNEKDICQAEAKAKEKLAKAELEQRFEPSAAHARKVHEAKAEGDYEVAKEKCESNKDGASACKKEAKAKYERAKADIKVNDARAEGNRDRTAGAGTTGSKERR
jgi:hypothetical protein